MLILQYNAVCRQSVTLLMIVTSEQNIELPFFWIDSVIRFPTFTQFVFVLYLNRDAENVVKIQEYLIIIK